MVQSRDSQMNLIVLGDVLVLCPVRSWSWGSARQEKTIHHSKKYKTNIIEMKFFHIFVTLAHLLKQNCARKISFSMLTWSWSCLNNPYKHINFSEMQLRSSAVNMYLHYTDDRSLIRTLTSCDSFQTVHSTSNIISVGNFYSISGVGFKPCNLFRRISHQIWL